ncbi:MAG: 2-oxoacid:acceptor oxidoreductase family protein [Oscillospiraceae bacterium]|jgi:indolepyruvate ferredoxin oxidoreductase beta subunit|nr:2-oxoacid:acceptor oxidoreductase family protein [Oscillospiraceae bacterium]
MQNLNILIAGVGGQGTVLLARLVADMALAQGARVRGSETIGMAQRGGSVVSHVRIGQSDSPLISPGGADVLLAFEPGEALRALPYLKEGGALAVCDRIQPSASAGRTKEPVPASTYLEQLHARVPQLTLLPFSQVLDACGSAKPLNVALLGAAIAAGLLPFSTAQAIAALHARVPERFWALNETALQCTGT